MIIAVLQSAWFVYLIYYLYIYVVAPASVVIALVSLFLYHKSKRDSQSQNLSLSELITIMVSLEKRLRKVEELTYQPPARQYGSTFGSNIAPIVQTAQIEPPVAEARDQSNDALPTQPAPQEPPLNAFCRLYNEGVDDPQKRAMFHERYHITRVSTVNATLRRRDPNLSPDFQTAPSGEFFCAAMHDARMHAVVPCFDLIYRDLIHNAGAMSFVFETPGYNPRLSYHRVKVVKPALFEVGAGQTWTRKECGILDLGQGESL